MIYDSKVPVKQSFNTWFSVGYIKSCEKTQFLMQPTIRYVKHDLNLKLTGLKFNRYNQISINQLPKLWTWYIKLLSSYSQLLSIRGRLTIVLFITIYNAKLFYYFMQTMEMVVCKSWQIIIKLYLCGWY